MWLVRVADGCVIQRHADHVRVCYDTNDIDTSINPKATSQNVKEQLDAPGVLPLLSDVPT